LSTLENIAVFPAFPSGEGEEKGVKDNDGLHKRRGIWHTRVKIDGRWKELSLGTRNYNEARKNRQTKIEEFEAKVKLPDLAKLPFKQAADLWLGERRKVVAANTYRIDRERLKPLEDKFSGKKLCDITAQDLRAYQLIRIEKVSPRTVNLEMKVLRHLLRTARCWSRLADDYKSLREERGGPGRALTDEEESNLFKIAMNDPNASSAYFAAIAAANTSMRGCELKGLRLKDVDLMGRTVAIRRSGTKTSAGVRLIPLNETAMWAFTRLIERAHALKSTEPEHYLFPAFLFRKTRDGQCHGGTGYDPKRPQVSWRTGWENLIRRAGLAGLRFHDLRHHCITRLAEKGIADQTLMAIAGHVSKAMLDHYSHVRIEARRKAVAMLDNGQNLLPNNNGADGPDRQIDSGAVN
jgi:integrase